MSVQVPAGVLNQTDKCWRGSTCLIEGKSFCEVWYSSSALNILFLLEAPPSIAPTAFPSRGPTSAAALSTITSLNTRKRNCLLPRQQHQ